MAAHVRLIHARALLANGNRTQFLDNPIALGHLGGDFQGVSLRYRFRPIRIIELRVIPFGDIGSIILCFASQAMEAGKVARIHVRPMAFPIRSAGQIHFARAILDLRLENEARPAGPIELRFRIPRLAAMTGPALSQPDSDAVGAGTKIRGKIARD